MARAENCTPTCRGRAARRIALPTPFPAARVPTPIARSSPSPPDTPPRAAATPPGPAPCVTSAVAPAGWNPGGARTDALRLRSGAASAEGPTQLSSLHPHVCVPVAIFSRGTPTGVLSLALEMIGKRCRGGGLDGSLAAPSPAPLPVGLSAEKRPVSALRCPFGRWLSVCSQNVLPSEHLPQPRSMPSPGWDP